MILISIGQTERDGEKPTPDLMICVSIKNSKSDWVFDLLLLFYIFDRYTIEDCVFIYSYWILKK